MEKKKNDATVLMDSIFGRCKEGFIEVRLIPKNKDPKKVKQLFIPISRRKEIPNILNGYKEHIEREQCGCHFAPATHIENDGTRNGILHLWVVWVDVDLYKLSEEEKAEVRNRYAEFKLKASFIVNSGGGIHIYWLLRTPALREDLPKVKNILKRLALFFHGDISATDVTHLLRIPKTLNFKYTPPEEVEFNDCNPAREYDLSNFENILPEVEETSNGEERPYRQETNERLNQIMECEFLKHCDTDRATLPEPEWFAMVSILARETGGPNLIHNLSKGYPKYSQQETDKKILHAINDAGPATCERIKRELWDCGKDCGVTSPAGLAFRARECESRNHTPETKISERLKLTYPTSHLRNFDLSHKSLGLFGEEYVPIAKVCWYYLLGQASREVVRFGRIKTDLRFPVAFILPSGHGKLNISSVIDRVGQGMGNNVSNPTSYHPEQLIGKVLRIEQKKGEVKYRQVRGHFDADTVIFDDGVDLIQSKDPVYKESRRYLCKCLDVIGDNLITKKQVDIPKEEALKYYPKCSVIVFFQPFSLPEESFLNGVFRRFPIAYMNFDERDFSNEFEQRLEDGSPEDQIKDFASYLLDVREELKHPPTFPKGFKNSFKGCHSLLVSFGRTFGPKASNFTRMMAFTLQNWLLKMSVILTRSEKRTEVNELDVERAFVDLLEILDSTFRFVEKKVQGHLDYGESWSGATGCDQSILEWLALKGATSEEGSNVTIDEYEKKIQEVMKYSDAGARKRYQRHKKNGWIESNQRQQATRVWLSFRPPKEADDLLGVLDVPVSQRYLEILAKIDGGIKNPKGSRVTVSPRTPRNETTLFEGVI